jgi:hypothetical protein
MLRGGGWQLGTDFSGQSIGTMCKGQAVPQYMSHTFRVFLQVSNFLLKGFGSWKTALKRASVTCYLFLVFRLGGEYYRGTLSMRTVWVKRADTRTCCKETGNILFQKIHILLFKTEGIFFLIFSYIAFVMLPPRYRSCVYWYFSFFSISFTI